MSEQWNAMNPDAKDTLHGDAAGADRFRSLFFQI